MEQIQTSRAIARCGYERDGEDGMRAVTALGAAGGVALSGAGYALGSHIADREAQNNNWGAIGYLLMALGAEAAVGTAALGAGLALRSRTPAGAPLAAAGAGLLTAPAAYFGAGMLEEMLA
jgi:hypothetical protein